MPSAPAHREINSESCEIKLNLDFNHVFPFGLASNRNPLACGKYVHVRSIGGTFPGLV